MKKFNSPQGTKRANLFETIKIYGFDINKDLVHKRCPQCKSFKSNVAYREEIDQSWCLDCYNRKYMTRRHIHEQWLEQEHNRYLGLI